LSYGRISGRTAHPNGSQPTGLYTYKQCTEGHTERQCSTRVPGPAAIRRANRSHSPLLEPPRRPHGPAQHP